MADIDIKAAASGSIADAKLVFGADDQSAASPQVYAWSAVKTWVKAWIAKADVGLGNVDNTSDATKNAAAVTLTNKTLTSPVINTPTGIVKGDVGLGNVANVDTTNASNISSGTLPAAQLPNPSASTLGGVQSAAAQTHKFITSISTAGVPVLAQPTAADVSGVGASNFPASTSPTVSDDNTQGYAAGARWMRLDTGEQWVCRDASTGAAKWDKQDSADHFGYIAANWYFPPGVTMGPTPGAPSANTIYVTPLVIKERCTLSALAARVGSSQAAQNCQLAIYASNPTTKMPTGNALSSTANISTASGTTNISAALGANQQIEPGLYWLAFNTSSTTATFAVVSAAGGPATALIGSSALTNMWAAASAIQLLGFTVSQSFGTWPDLTSASFTEVANNLVPLMAFKVLTTP